MVAADAHDRGGSLEHLVGTTLDLSDRLHDVERVARDVACVGTLQARERLHLVDRVELRPEHPRCLTYRMRPEPRTRPEAHSGVERDPEDRDVAAVEVLQLRQANEGRRSRVSGHDGAADRLDRGLAVRDLAPSLDDRGRMLAPVRVAVELRRALRGFVGGQVLVDREPPSVALALEDDRLALVQGRLFAVPRLGRGHPVTEDRGVVEHPDIGIV